MNYLLSGETDTKGLVVQLLNKMSEDSDQMEEIITETGKRMNLSLLEILSEKSLYKRRKIQKKTSSASSFRMRRREIWIRMIS